MSLANNHAGKDNQFQPKGYQLNNTVHLFKTMLKTQDNNIDSCRITGSYNNCISSSSQAAVSYYK